MGQFAALLRGINVSGQKKILMAELRATLTKAGLSNVKTYIQSGNVVFESEKSADTLEKDIHETILKRFGFEVPVMVLTIENINKAIQENPYPERAEENHKKVYFTFLSQNPDSRMATELEKEMYEGETLEIKGKTAFFYSENPYGKSKLNNNYIEKKLKLRATTRNYKTVMTLKEMLEE